MFSKILIANRGEIACRIARTARVMGVRTVGVFSDADGESLHVASMDEAVHIGGAAAADSYLLGERIIAAAKRTGAEAIHPGYGFLSENADFAQTCADAGIAFIGPPPDAIRAMGSKSAAKSLMADAGVPVVPGYHGEDQSIEALTQAATSIGFPLLVKASAGGGGKGMRIVRDGNELSDAIAGAQREALASFADSRLLLERYLTNPRHVEIQVFFDGHGDGVHLFERDCSIQRRYQKVLEEAPAPGVDADTRQAMYDAAVACARAVGYVGAGTVELIMDSDGSFYFMEMNTRLQVEHPVTEMVTGVDLVEWQLRVAAGEPLPLAQGDLTTHGHAVEVRLYAEDPTRGFLPSTGTLDVLEFPVEDEHLRIDSAVREGDAVSIHYDPMIAKVIAWAPTREDALARLQRAMAATKVRGVTTNAAFLARMLENDSLIAGPVDTGFLDRHGEALIAHETLEPEAVARASLIILAERHIAAKDKAGASAEPDSPWHASDSWTMNHVGTETLTWIHDDAQVSVQVRHLGTQAELTVGDHRMLGFTNIRDGRITTVVDGHLRHEHYLWGDNELAMNHGSASCVLTLLDPLATAQGEEVNDAQLRAPMPGKVIACHVQTGDTVTRGQVLALLEAMKMEHNITAPHDGTIAEVRYQTGDLVDEGAELFVLDE
jgi:3-methylcrotonyl-CoA carboxylase alpha subunit